MDYLIFLADQFQLYIYLTLDYNYSLLPALELMIRYFILNLTLN